MGKAVMETTSTQCGDIQDELMELRTMTKKELSSLQGVLEVGIPYNIIDSNTCSNWPTNQPYRYK